MKSTNKISLPGRVFDAVNILFLLLLVSTMVIPFLNTLALAFSSNFASMQPGIVLWPKEFSLEGFSTVWNRMKLYLPFTNNVIVTVVGTVGHVFLSSMAGYVLIQKGFPEKVDVIRDPVNDDDSERGDHDPAVYRESGFRSPKHAVLIDTFGFRIRLQRRAHAKFLLSVPYEMSESARIDGAGDLRIFFTMYLPLARAGLATVTLFEFVSRWNQFTPALLYINDSSKYTLQIALKSLIVDTDSTSSNFLITTNVRMAGIVIALLPLIIIYPYVQKYFVKGMFVGANKE